MGRLRGAAFVGVLLMACLGCTSGDSAAKQLRVLTCPECRLELPYTDKLDGKPCPSCGKPSIRMVAGIKGDDGPTPVWHTLIAVGVVVAVVLLTGLYFWLRRRSEKAQLSKIESDPELRCRCPFCRRKFKYLAHQAGDGIACPQCKTAFVFPAIGESDVLG